jgi:hypothetical protein
MRLFIYLNSPNFIYKYIYVCVYYTYAVSKASAIPQLYENGKMRPIKTIPGMWGGGADKGEW